MGICFLHTSDWQLGMTRHFLSDGAQERYTQARFDAIRAMGRIVKEEKCQFILVCGDTFESNQVDRKTVSRALEALKDIPVPVYLLPGNHDPLNAASVYHSSTFTDKKPSHVCVIENSDPIKVLDEVEIVGAPWLSKRPAINPVDEVLRALNSSPSVTRICIAHGGVDQFTPDKEAPGIIPVAALEKVLEEGKIHYVALGDRHSLTSLGSSERIWYSGTPESTDFSELQSGFVQVVEIDEGRVYTKAIQIGQWQFMEMGRVDLNTSEDIEALRKTLEGVERKELTVIRMNLFGALSLSLFGKLERDLIVVKDVFGACDIRDNELLVIPEDIDFTSLGFSGFAETTVKKLRDQMNEGKEDSIAARDALMLLLQLTKEAA